MFIEKIFLALVWFFKLLAKMLLLYSVYASLLLVVLTFLLIYFVRQIKFKASQPTEGI